MQQTQQPNKRIVGKGEYAANVGKKVSMSTFGMLLLLLCVICLLTTVAVLPSTVSVFAALIVLVLGVGGSLYVGYLGGRTIKEARQIDAGIPFIHANTADLPAPDSLVRASAEPVQAQEAILLRAAVDTQEQNETQLLRAKE